MTKNISISLEFFPPKTEKGDKQLIKNASRLAELNPKFMSVTYGAGGSSKENSFDTAFALQNHLNIPVASHLTCIATPKPELHEIADYLWNNGIKSLVVLRGDFPGEQGLIMPEKHDDNYYHFTSNFVEGLLERHDFDISVAAYPEKHPEAPSLADDIEALRKKISAGANRAITQFFYVNENYLSFLEQSDKAGIDTSKIVPGILPVYDFRRIAGFAEKCGAIIPKRMYKLFDGVEPYSSEEIKISKDLLAEQIEYLIERNICNFHIYTLNRSKIIKDVLSNHVNIERKNNGTSR